MDPQKTLRCTFLLSNAWCLAWDCYGGTFPKNIKLILQRTQIQALSNQLHDSIEKAQPKIVSSTTTTTTTTTTVTNFKCWARLPPRQLLSFQWLWIEIKYSFWRRITSYENLMKSENSSSLEIWSGCLLIYHHCHHLNVLFHPRLIMSMDEYGWLLPNSIR